MSDILKTGDTAPDFSLHNQDGRPVSLKDKRGNWVVLYFYPKDNTSGCTQEAMDFSESVSQFRQLGAVILGISPDSETSHAKFAKKHDLSVELLSDPNHEVLEKYGFWRQKKMYGKEYMGVARSTVLIDPEGNVQKVWENVKVKNHVREVKESLSSLI
jgi:peroxiredoxin Q/BCP